MIILGTFEKVKLRSARIFVTETHNLKIKIPLVYLLSLTADWRKSHSSKSSTHQSTEKIIF